MKSIKQILIERDDMSEKEAEDLIVRARDKLFIYLQEGDFEAAQDVCGEFFGLEPDYLIQLI